MPRSLLALVASTALALTGTALAQHTGFTLIGEPNPAADKAPAEHRFVHPVTSPYFHEDSFVTTDIRAWALYHKFPSGGTIDGGDAQVYAVQVRVAITDRLQLVAYKDGYLVMDSGLLSEDGWNDVAAGLKYALVQDFENQFHLAVGAGYEFPIGDRKVLQNNGEARVWASVNKGFGALHLGATVNYFIGTSSDDLLGNSDYLSWHAHADYYVNEWFSPVIELNGYHVMNEDVATPFSGIDVTNLGGGEDVVSLGLGAEIRPAKNVAFRAAYEFPVTDNNDDLYGWRITFSGVYSF